MKELNCDSLDMAIEFDESIFNKSAFLKDRKIKDKQASYFVYHFDSKNKRKNEFVHVQIILNGAESVLNLNYSQGKEKAHGQPEYFLENFPPWLSSFFSEPKLPAFCSLYFRFDSREPSVPLRYPLPAENIELLKETLITGYELEFARDALVFKGIVSTNDKDVFILLSGKILFTLATFEFRRLIADFYEYATALVKET